MKPFISPILDALVNHMNQEPVSFHVPGHRYGKSLELQLPIKDNKNHPAVWFEKIMKLDVTELSSTDDLHHPEAFIKEAQLLAAKTFNADETFFLVGGSTSGNIALILTLCDPGDTIIVQRNVHKSILNGLKLAGAKAVFLTPQIDPQTELSTVPDLQQLNQALRLYPQAKAVMLSNPNYYGMGVSLKAYVELAHRHGKPIVVDEAHGAHFGFHHQLPKSAIAAGADAIVQSAHKTLPAMTMGAMLHVQGEHINREALKQNLAMIQSSSPSFPILASLDISRAMIDSLGSLLFEQSISSAAAFREWLRKQAFTIREACTTFADDDGKYHDPLRVVLYDSSCRLSGIELQRRLEQFGCYAEMADPRYTVLVFGIYTSGDEIIRLQDAIMQIMKAMDQTESQKLVTLPVGVTISTGGISEPVSFARDRFKYEKLERIDIMDAKHRVSAEMVMPYPPGIAILYPGELITSGIFEQIKRLSEAGAKFQGAADPSMGTIAVFHSASAKSDLP